jgi:hypothetical protein
MATAIVLHPDGNIEEINLPADTRENLAAMYKAIGCSLVDVVRLTTTLDMWLDDEGMYTQPVNLPATALARKHGYVWQPYHGTVVLCGVDEDGNSIDLTGDQMRGLLAHMSDAADDLDDVLDDL